MQVAVDRLILDDRPQVRAERTLRQWISNGFLPLGERLPSEQNLADRLKVSRPTVRLAIQQLQDQGMIVRLENRNRVVATPGSAHQGALAHTVIVLGCEFFKEEPDYQRSSGWSLQRQHAVLGTLREAGFDAMIVDEQSLTVDKARQLASGRPHGMIAVESETWGSVGCSRMADAFRPQGTPIVVYGSQPIAGCDRVSSDHAAGCQALTRWLIDQGRRRILRFWTGPGCSSYRTWLRDRDAGYEKAMREAGLDVLPAVWPGLAEPLGQAFEVRTRSIAGWLVDQLQREPAVDAILAASDGEIYPIAAACRMLGKTPGRDVLITGYDDFWMDSPERQFEAYVPAATVDKRNPEIGQTLVNLLQERLAGKLPPEPQHRVIAPQFLLPSLQGGMPLSSDLAQ